MRAIEFSDIKSAKEQERVSPNWAHFTLEQTHKNRPFLFPTAVFHVQLLPVCKSNEWRRNNTLSFRLNFTLFGPVMFSSIQIIILNRKKRNQSRMRSILIALQFWIVELSHIHWKINLHSVLPSLVVKDCFWEIESKQTKLLNICCNLTKAPWIFWLFRCL